MWLLFRHRNKGILAFLRTRNMVFANLTYLDSLNMYIALYSYKALMGLSEKRLVSTEPLYSNIHGLESQLKTERTDLFYSERLFWPSLFL